MDAPPKVKYSPHPSIEYARNCIRALEKRSGLTLEQWVERAKTGPESEEARREWLKDAHGLGTNYAWWITARSLGLEDDLDEEVYLRKAPAYVDALYSGPREHLRPLHDALVQLGLSLGDDVRICPCETMVPLYRNHVFAQIKPATNKRIDLGLCLRGVEPDDRLLSTGGEAKGDRITHRMALTSLEEIDSEVNRRLGEAYIRDA